MGRPKRRWKVTTWIKGVRHQACWIDGLWRLYRRSNLLPIVGTWRTYDELRSWIASQYQNRSRKPNL